MADGRSRLDALKRNPTAGWTIAEIEAVCRAHGISCLPPRRGSHYKVAHPTQAVILTIPARRPIKPVYIRNLVKFIENVIQAGQ